MQQVKLDYEKLNNILFVFSTNIEGLERSAREKSVAGMITSSPTKTPSKTTSKTTTMITTITITMITPYTTPTPPTHHTPPTGQARATAIAPGGNKKGLRMV